MDAHRNNPTQQSQRLQIWLESQHAFLTPNLASAGTSSEVALSHLSGFPLSLVEEWADIHIGDHNDLSKPYKDCGKAIISDPQHEAFGAYLPHGRLLEIKKHHLPRLCAMPFVPANGPRSEKNVRGAKAILDSAGNKETPRVLTTTGQIVNARALLISELTAGLLGRLSNLFPGVTFVSLFEATLKETLGWCNSTEASDLAEWQRTRLTKNGNPLITPLPDAWVVGTRNPFDKATALTYNLVSRGSLMEAFSMSVHVKLTPEGASEYIAEFRNLPRYQAAIYLVPDEKIREGIKKAAEPFSHIYVPDLAPPSRGENIAYFCETTLHRIFRYAETQVPDKELHHHLEICAHPGLPWLYRIPRTILSEMNGAG